MSDYFAELGKFFSKLMARGSIERCNCMIRQRIGSDQLPAIRRGKGSDAKFFTPQGDEIESVVSFEDMHPNVIAKLMKDRGEEYIGHMFGPFRPT